MVMERENHMNTPVSGMSLRSPIILRKRHSATVSSIVSNFEKRDNPCHSSNSNNNSPVSSPVRSPVRSPNPTQQRVNNNARFTCLSGNNISMIQNLSKPQTKTTLSSWQGMAQKEKNSDEVDSGTTQRRKSWSPASVSSSQVCPSLSPFSSPIMGNNRPKLERDRVLFSANSIFGTKHMGVIYEDTKQVTNTKPRSSTTASSSGSSNSGCSSTNGMEGENSCCDKIVSPASRDYPSTVRDIGETTPHPKEEPSPPSSPSKPKSRCLYRHVDFNDDEYDGPRWKPPPKEEQGVFSPAGNTRHNTGGTGGGGCVFNRKATTTTTFSYEDKELVKSKFFRKNFDKKAFLIQNLWRGHKARKRCQRMRKLQVKQKAAIQIQRLSRMILAKRALKQKRYQRVLDHHATIIQALYRGIQGRIYYQHYKITIYATKIQSIVRRYLARLQYRLDRAIKAWNDQELITEQQLGLVEKQKRKKFKAAYKDAEYFFLKMDQLDELKKVQTLYEEQNRTLEETIVDMTRQAKLMKKQIHRHEDSQRSGDCIYRGRKIEIQRYEYEHSRYMRLQDDYMEQIQQVQKKIQKKEKKWERERCKREKIQMAISNIATMLTDQYEPETHDDETLVDRITLLCNRRY